MMEDLEKTSNLCKHPFQSLAFNNTFTKRNWSLNVGDEAFFYQIVSSLNACSELQPLLTIVDHCNSLVRFATTVSRAHNSGVV